MYQLARNALVASTIGLGVVASASANVQTFTDRAAWEIALNAAAGSAFELVEEQFDGPRTNFVRESTGNAIGAFTLDLIGFGERRGIRLTGGGFFEGEVDSSPYVGNDGQDLRFSAGPSFGFGLLGLRNDSVTAPGSLNVAEIGLVIGGESYLASDILGLTDPNVSGNVRAARTADEVPFIGFVSDTPVDGLVFTHGDRVRRVSGGAEEFYLDALIAARHRATASVPEPATALLSGLGLALVLVARRRA